MAKPKLNNNDFCRAAKKLNCEVAAVKAIDEQESRGKGFDSQDRPIILFERHHFSRLTKRKYDATHPHISNQKAGGYGKTEAQYGRFSEAFMLNPKAAMMSASWGRFQIMGFNHALVGFASVDEFVDAMKESEGSQLDAFCEFVLHNDLDDELRRHDWAGFARGYNGKNYKINQYDVKIAAAYKKFAREKIDCSNLAAAPLGESTQKEQAESSKPADSPTFESDSAISDPTPTQPPIAPPTAVVEVEQISAEKDEPKQEDFITRMSNRFVAIPAMVLSALGAAVTWATSAPLNLVLVLVGVGAFIALVYMTTTSIRNAGKEKREMELKKIREAQAFELQRLVLMSAASTTQNTVRIVSPPPVTEIQNSDAPEEG